METRPLTYCAPKRLGKDFCFFDLGTVDLGADHGTERHLCTEFMGNCECECGLARPWGTNKQQGTPREFSRFNEVHDNTTSLECQDVSSDSLKLGFFFGRTSRAFAWPMNPEPSARADPTAVSPSVNEVLYARSGRPSWPAVVVQHCALRGPTLTPPRTW
jgi:hypothetical protein